VSESERDFTKRIIDIFCDNPEEKKQALKFFNSPINKLKKYLFYIKCKYFSWLS